MDGSLQLNGWIPTAEWMDPYSWIWIPPAQPPRLLLRAATEACEPLIPPTQGLTLTLTWGLLGPSASPRGIPALRALATAVNLTPGVKCGGPAVTLALTLFSLPAAAAAASAECGGYEDTSRLVATLTAPAHPQPSLQGTQKELIR